MITSMGPGTEMEIQTLVWSILGPTLFMICVNDILDNLDSQGKLFADDANIYRRI